VQQSGGVISTPALRMTCKSYTDMGGIVGTSITKTIALKAYEFTFRESLFVIKDSASIEAPEDSPSIIRSFGFTKKAGARSVFLQGTIDFNKKDENLAGSETIPGFLFSGIQELDITFDKTKF
jgi:hypothetical protein